MNIKPFILLAMLSAISACGAESLKKTGFETLQSYGRVQCERDPWSRCPQRERYEDYQKERKKVLDPQ